MAPDHLLDALADEARGLTPAAASALFAAAGVDPDTGQYTPAARRAACTDAALAAMTVPGINRAEFRATPDGPAGTVRYASSGLFGDDTGPTWPARRDPDGWDVNGHRDRDLATAIRAAIRGCAARSRRNS
jgi:hypothetical protein